MVAFPHPTVEPAPDPARERLGRRRVAGLAHAARRHTRPLAATAGLAALAALAWIAPAGAVPAGRAGDPCRAAAAELRTGAAQARPAVSRGMLTRSGGFVLETRARVTCILATEGYGHLRLVLTPGHRLLPLNVLIGHVADPRTPAAKLAGSTSGLVDVDLHGARFVFVAVRNTGERARTVRVSYWLAS
jgi:hypothetical protein